MDINDAPLRKRQLDMLRVLYQLSEELAYPPSVRELAEAMDLASASSAKHHLDILEENGFIRRVPNCPRALEIISLPAELAQELSAPLQPLSAPAATPAAPSEPLVLPVSVVDDGPAAAIPLVGRIAAGNPILADQVVEDAYSIPRRFTGSGEMFMLQVSGDSMIEAAIWDGDWVVVRRQNSAVNGEIVAAMIDGEATVKEFSKVDGHLWLLPHNSSYAPINGDQAVILGKVVTVIRSL